MRRWCWLMRAGCPGAVGAAAQERAGSGVAVADRAGVRGGDGDQEIAAGMGVRRRRSASGGAGSSPAGWTGCSTSRGPDSRARSPTRRSSGCSRRRWRIQPADGHPLVDPLDGPGDGDEPDRRQPHLAGVRAEAASQETFKLSPDPLFIDKVRDIVGLYIDPPEARCCLCVDEKTQIQALDRTAPLLPMLPTGPGPAQPRLRPQRHHHPVRRPRCRHRPGHRRTTPPAPLGGVPELS